MVTGADGNLYLTHGNRIVRLDPRTEELAIAHTADSRETPILAASDNGILFSRRHELWLGAI